MPEITEDRLNAKLSTIPPEKHEAYKASLQKRGYTWTPAQALSASPARSLKDKLLGYANTANYLSPFPAAAQYAMDPEKTKKVYEAGLAGLRQKPTESDIPEAQGMNVVGKYGPAIAATAAFPPSAMADLAGIGALRYAPQLGKAGFQAARLAAGAGVAGAEGGLATLGASALAGDPAVEESLQAGKDYAMGEGVAGAAIAGAPPVWRGLKSLATGTLERATSLGAGVSPAAWEALRQMPEEVAGHARRGMTRTMENKPISRGLEAAQGMVQSLKDKSSEIKRAAQEKANEFGFSAQGRIKQVTEGASKSYGQMMEYLANDVSGDRFSVAEKVYDRMEPYIKTQGATLRHPVGAGEESASKAIMDIYGEIKNSAAEGMAPATAAEYLQRLTAIQRNGNLGKSANAHAKKLKNALMEALPGEYRIPTIDTPTPRGWGIREERARYASAKEAERGLKPFTAAQAPEATLERLMAAGGRTSKVLKAAMGKKGIPGFAEDVASMRAAKAAAAPEIASAAAAAQPGINAAKAGGEFAPKVTRSLPRTGLMGALLTSAGSLNTPAGVLAAPLAVLGLSPRLAMNTYLAAGKGAAPLEKFMGANASKFPPVVANAIRAAREKKEKK